MPTIRVIGFEADLFEAALQEIVGRTILVFPTRSSAGVCEKNNYRYWCFEDISFISIEDLKTSLLSLDHPELMDDKRLLCLYQAMAPEMREYFHIFGFEDIVTWGEHFFRFFEELDDEEISIEHLREMELSGALNLQEWQEHFLANIVNIREAYRIFITQLGYTDKIFSRCRDNLHVPATNARYVFVNQYYYSKLERDMISELEKAGNSVCVIFQGDPESLPSSELELSPLNLYRVFTGESYSHAEIHIKETQNEDQMVLALLEEVAGRDLAGKEPQLLIDAGFRENAYNRLFDPDLFGLGHNYSFDRTFLYKFLVGIREDLRALATSKDGKYIPLRNIFDSLSDKRFTQVFCGEAVSGDEVIKQLLVLTGADMIYVDINLELFDIWETDQDLTLLKQVLAGYFTILEEFLAIGDPDDLIQLLTSQTLKLDDLISPDELACADIPEQLADRLENFQALSRLGVVTNWQDIFGTKQAEVAAGILELFIASLKTATIHRHKLSQRSAQFEVTNLLDSRNLSRDEIIFFNTIEGIIPSAPEPVWLFNERQRMILGLKAYENIREWERYYFLRMILSAKRVDIYTYTNNDKDIEPSSFISELLHLRDFEAIGQTRIITDEVDLPDIKGYYAVQMKNKSGKCAEDPERGLDPSKPGDFFNMPFDPALDQMGKRYFSLTYYSASQLLRNPFLWYLEYSAKLKESHYEVEETLTRKFFGTLIHDYLSSLLKEISKDEQTIWDVKERFGDTEVLLRAFLILLEKPIYQYKLPQNYNWDFLRDVISTCIAETVTWFFSRFLPELLGQERFILIPEDERSTRSELLDKELFSLDVDGVTYVVGIHGKADLRIETKKKYYIVDFKTGKVNTDQLIFYELCYYLLDGLSEDIRLESVFAKILEQDKEQKTFTDKDRNKFILAMQDRITEVVNKGFGLSRKASDRTYKPDITRADLYSLRMMGEE
ncbi:MAG TPA: PD-(D/E)XK nuclease family protein [Candidatus Cloacimonadota bacterium]|nr:PD-(D/E)XK nuclease family protein [Candidatus Cloacimonadota bacterium]